MSVRRTAFGMPLGEVVEHSGACPDCDADARLTEWEPGVYRLEIRHDDACPTHRTNTNKEKKK